MIVTILLLLFTDTGSSQDLVSVANTYLNDRNYTEAKSAIDEALTDSELVKNPRAWYTKGRVYHEILKSKDPDLNQFKKDVNAFVGSIVEAYNKTKELAGEGGNLYTMSNNQIKLLWFEAINQGVTYFQSSDYNKALNAFAIAKIANPEDTLSYIYTGFSAQNAKKYQMALDNFEVIKQRGTPSKDVHSSIIMCTKAMGKSLQEQLETIEQALFDYPDHIPYVLQEVITLVNLGKFVEAESRLKTVLQRNPDSYELKLRQADLFDRIFKQAFVAGRPDRSERYFEMASTAYEEFLVAFPNHFTANYNYAIMINEKANRYYVRANLMSKEEYEISGEEVQELGHDLTRKALPLMERARLVMDPEKDKRTAPKVIEALKVFYKRLKMDEKLASLGG